MIQFQCIECERRRAELTGQLETLTSKISQRASEEQTTYGICLDTEDQKLIALPLDLCYERGYTPISIISKYQ